MLKVRVKSNRVTKGNANGIWLWKEIEAALSCLKEHFTPGNKNGNEGSILSLASCFLFRSLSSHSSNMLVLMLPNREALFLNPVCEVEDYCVPLTSA